ncbi:MAG: hypothetical protein QOJ29_2858 [Thermoleophilaceae bacterium]|jgi:hypothetical protein|nr:hypothetical protein [Thermoleophilaceae bacterium]
MSTGQRLAILGAIIVVAVAGIIIASSGDSSGAPKTANVTIDVKNAKPVGGVKKIKIKQGGTLNLTVNSDTADEVHVHATDQHKDVEKGGTLKLTIKPTGTGNSEIELEGHKQQLAELTIEP